MLVEARTSAFAFAFSAVSSLLVAFRTPWSPATTGSCRRLHAQFGQQARGEAACEKPLAVAMVGREPRQCKLQSAVVWAQSRPDRSLLCDLSFVRPPGTPAEASDAYSQSSFRGAWFDQHIVQAFSALAWQLGEPQASRELRKAAQVRIPGSCTPCLGDKVSSPTSKSGSGRELHIIPVQGIQMAET